jgi:YD repeat-containing protein
MALNGVSSTVNWDSTLRLSSSVGPYGETSFTWDYEDRPLTRSNPDGSKAEIEYSYASAVTTERTGGRWTKSYLDGLGRPVRIEQGYGGKLQSGTRTPEVAESVVEKVYEPCACGPFGKLKRESLPRAIGDPAVSWNVYTYDDTGRIVNIKHAVADLGQLNVNQGETLYTYGAEPGSDVPLATAKVQMPVTASSQAQWKKTGMDGFGNLRRVWEPNPAGGEYVTDYSYNLLGQLTQVTMSRDGISNTLPQTVTQTRSFEYDSYGRLKATVFPETGRTEYTYVNGRLDTRKNQLGEELQYVYDNDKARLIKKQYRSSAQSQWQTASQMTYNAAGRPATISYSRSGLGSITETYTYTTVGQLQAKQLAHESSGTPYGPHTLTVSWTYDAEGRVDVMTYPSGKKVRYKYDGKEKQYAVNGPGQLRHRLQRGRNGGECDL